MKEVEPDIIDMCMLPTLKATSYRSIYAYGNHFRMRSAKTNLSTIDCGVAATSNQECHLGPRDRNTMRALVEYVGWIEEILEIVFVNSRQWCFYVIG